MLPNLRTVICDTKDEAISKAFKVQEQYAPTSVAVIKTTDTGREAFYVVPDADDNDFVRLKRAHARQEVVFALPIHPNQKKV